MNKPAVYPTHVYWDERDRGYIAIAPDLPGCSAFGDTKSKALRELERAIEAWIETANDDGRPLPVPSPPPAPARYSGKVLLRLPSSLHEQLARGAEREGVSLNQWLVMLLASETALRKKAPAAAVPIERIRVRRTAKSSRSVSAKRRAAR